MTPLRIGFDVDGVIADFATAFRALEVELFGPASRVEADRPEEEAAEEEKPRSRRPPSIPALIEQRRRREAIWQVIHRTPDFWMTLEPLDRAAVPRLHEMTLRHGWEVFFITQRPATAGHTVQRQTQGWLRQHGFDLPSVLVIGGSRGAAAAALRLAYHVDDNPQNCLDVSAESGAEPILILPDRHRPSPGGVNSLGFRTARSIAEALDLLEQVSRGQGKPTLLSRLSRLIGRQS